MSRKNPAPEESVQRDKIRELLQMANIGSMDDIHCHVCSKGQIVKKAVYIAIGVNLDGRKDVLGMWFGETESAKFWTTVLNGPKNGVQRMFSLLAPTIWRGLRESPEKFV